METNAPNCEPLRHCDELRRNNESPCLVGFCVRCGDRMDPYSSTQDYLGSSFLRLRCNAQCQPFEPKNATGNCYFPQYSDKLPSSISSQKKTDWTVRPFGFRRLGWLIRIGLFRIVVKVMLGKKQSAFSLWFVLTTALPDGIHCSKAFWQVFLSVL